MTDIKLWKLKEIDIRNVRQHEQYDFSAWLAEHVNELWDELGFSLTDVETEKLVWWYRCDILCKDENTDKTVLIENQLEPTNHDHLWKIITYASWLKADVVIWVVEKAREEHKSAIDWLNEHTDDWISFFLIEIHAYTIWDSLPAPDFIIIAKPNDFVREMRNDSWTTSSENSRLEFWHMLNEVIDWRWKPFNKQKPSKQNWFTVPVGSSACHISIDLVNTEHRIRIRLWIKDNKDLYDELYKNKNNIEKIFWKELIWDRMDNKKAASIHTYINWLNFDDKSNYRDLMNKCIDVVVDMKKAFKQYL